MEVILLEKIRNLGNIGDKVNVKPGYGRNYLIPQQKATFASKANIAAFESRRAELEEKAKNEASQAQERAEQIKVAKIIIAAKASEEGKLYGSIGTREIVQAFSKAGHEVKKNEIIMPHGSIHYVGSYEVELSLHSDVIFNASIEIVPEE